MIVLKMHKEHKEELVRRLQTYVEREFEQSIGNLAAESLLDFAVKLVGPHVYNQAVKDAHRVLLDEMTRLEDEIDNLEQPVLVSRQED